MDVYLFLGNKNKNSNTSNNNKKTTNRLNWKISSRILKHDLVLAWWICIHKLCILLLFQINVQKKHAHTQHFENTYLQDARLHSALALVHIRIRWHKWFIVIWHFKYSIPVGYTKLLHTACCKSKVCVFLVVVQMFSAGFTDLALFHFSPLRLLSFFFRFLFFFFVFHAKKSLFFYLIIYILDGIYLVCVQNSVLSLFFGGLERRLVGGKSDE